MEYHGTGGNVTVFSKSHFFSLKWKALLLTSLVLVAVTMAISLRSYINLNAQFDKHRRDAQERYSRNIEALTKSLNQAVTQSFAPTRQHDSFLTRHAAQSGER